MKQQGFTLIELMVVLVIIGIASAAISLTIKPDPLHLLRKDAERLSQLLQVAQAEARADGRPITWRADAKGFRFNRRSDDGAGRGGVPGRQPNCARAYGRARRCRSTSSRGKPWCSTPNGSTHPCA